MCKTFPIKYFNNSLAYRQFHRMLFWRVLIQLGLPESPAFLLLLVTDRQTDWLTDWLVGWLLDRVVTEKQNVFCLFGFLLMCHDWHFFVMRLHVMMRILMAVMMMMLLVVSLPMAKITNKYSIQFVIRSAKNVYLGTACNKSVGWSGSQTGRLYGNLRQFSVYKLPLMLNTVFGIVCLNKSQNVSKSLTDVHIYINTNTCKCTNTYAWMYIHILFINWLDDGSITFKWQL